MAVRPLAGIRQKIKRTDQHLRTLNQLARSFRKAGKCKVVVDFDPNTERHTFRIKISAQPRPPIMFSVIAGEVFHHLRSSLDHLVCQLVIREMGTAAPVRHLYFPVFLKQPTKPKEISRFKRMIKGVSPSAQAAIEALQPYQQRPPYEDYLLAVLADLDNTYKHRRVLVVGKALSQIVQSIGMVSGKSGHVARLSTADFKRVAPLKNGTEIGHFFGSEHMKVNVKTSAEIAFKDVGLAKLKPVIPGLYQLRQFVVGIIDDFERRFF